MERERQRRQPTATHRATQRHRRGHEDPFARARRLISRVLTDELRQLSFTATTRLHPRRTFDREHPTRQGDARRRAETLECRPRDRTITHRNRAIQHCPPHNPRLLAPIQQPHPRNHQSRPQNTTTSSTISHAQGETTRHAPPPPPPPLYPRPYRKRHGHHRHEAERHDDPKEHPTPAQPSRQQHTKPPTKTRAPKQKTPT